MDAETSKKLRAPFNPDQVGRLPKVTCRKCSSRDVQCGEHKTQKCRVCKGYLTAAHIHIDYVGHAHVTERLLDVDPGWSWEPMALDGVGLPALDESGGLWIRLTVGGKTMLGYGDAPGKRAAVKELIGDAIRNAGMRFGIALDLWKKEAPDASLPERQVDKPPQTPADRATELRGQINAIRKARGQTIAECADDFALWSKGDDISKASIALLAEYKDHIGRMRESDDDL